ncbi:MAG: 30S ribosomal protein S8e [Candidatus Nanoarchaeia archaeon]|jgi:small subunit ribosomal protein S8e|nr:30S ribosomal protein S8e [Candidatus Nanoarchaeia archaeon]|tara:strand:- start:1599 stop:1982 length:384 start_codon:yes stop_codon:yes gene_type:complete
MAITHSRPTKKVSGGKYQKYRKKRKYEKGNSPTHTKVGDRRSSKIRVRSKNFKFRVYSDNVVNVYDPKTKKYSKLKIKTIVETPANRHFVRRNIMTKGTIIETEKGKAKVTNRPGQENIINAILVGK